MGSLQQNSDDNDSGLIEGSETEEDNEFSHSDEEDIRTNGGATSEDSVDLRFVNVKALFGSLEGKGRKGFEGVQYTREN